MTNIFHHVKRHATNTASHVHKHHKKYLFGVFGGFAITKMLVFFIAGVGILNYSYSTFADNETGCVMTGEIYIEETQNCITIPAYLTGGYEECTITAEGYYTGGTLNESGELVDQEYIPPVESCVMTGQTTIEEVQECTTISGYYTGGTLWCPSVGDEQTTGTVEQTGDTQRDEQTGGFLSVAEAVSTGVCDSGDISWLLPTSGAFLKGTTHFSRSYLTDDCTRTGNAQLFTLQLYDHNNQWISLATLSSLATGYDFNTLLLSGYRNVSGLVTSGIYTVADASGVVLFTGIASGAYTNLRTGYRVRIVDQDSAVLFTSNVFTIDNVIPTLTGVALTSLDANSGTVGLDDQVTLTFTASEALSGLVVTLGGTGATFAGNNGLTYTYIQTLNSGFTQGVLAYSVAYTDLAGNTGVVVTGTGLVFDKTAPIVSGMTMTGTIASGLILSFATSEPARFALSYARTGTTAIAYTGTTYTTGHEYLLSGITTNIPYTLRLTVGDLVANEIVYSGSFTLSTTGAIRFVYEIYQNLVTTGTLTELTNVLKEEINKFNLCKSGLTYTGIALNINKNMYTLHMPEFTKDYVKKIVNAFTLLILDKVEKNKKLSKAEVTEITDKFDNFLIVLKLIRDNDNVCKQNLSNYHISQFKRALDEYGIYFK